MVRALQPEVVIESGSYHGETAAAIGQALLRNGHGKCYAVENDTERAAAARERCAGLPVEVVEQDIVGFTSPDPVQFAWIDSSPKRLEHLQHVMSQCQVGAIVGIHDTAPHKEIDLRALSLPNITLRTPRGVTFVAVGDNNEVTSEDAMEVTGVTEEPAEPADNDTHTNTVDDATITHKATRRGRGRPRKYGTP
jgi:predicted O-methyltransferase YrrM